MSLDRGGVSAGPSVPPTVEEFYTREHQRLYRALCLVTRDRHEAEELMQEAFLNVLERWERVRTVDDPTGYLYRTAMNAFRRRLRRAALATKRAVGLAPRDDGIARIEARDAAVRALAGLSRQQRAAVVLIDYLELTSEEAAGVLRIRAGTVRMHLSRARAALRETGPPEPGGTP